MTGTKQSDWMGAAECARRTGLTVRTLRIYERHELIEPMRSDKGWRRYGPKELQRLNVIVTLKAFGMTLEQIRKQLATKPPPLARVLQLQLENCVARRDTADRAVVLIKTALATIQSGKQLSVENLCDLTRSMEMEDRFSRNQIYRELVNETLTPDEERAIMTWIASRPPNEMKAMSESAPAGRAVLKSIQELQQNKVDPAAPEAQALVVRENEIAVQHGLRNFSASMFEWNGPLTEKWLRVGERAAWGETSSEAATPEDLVAYFRAARAASPWHRAFQPIVDDAAELADKKAQPSAAPAQALAGRVRQVCADHALGDPLVYVRNARAMQFRWPAGDVARKRAGWTFLANAIEVTATQ
ncbi:MAG TPA: MerR family transcriptional regulator [Rhizomicrobium sp.]|jgi:DNA-binding transcriptional MerR regulator|nr:MerR family transcriptional regulator [Rhizomicrobium sp.]